jgi:hypothetical protein
LCISFQKYLFQMGPFGLSRNDLKSNFRLPCLKLSVTISVSLYRISHFSVLIKNHIDQHSTSFWHCGTPPPLFFCTTCPDDQQVSGIVEECRMGTSPLFVQHIQMINKFLTTYNINDHQSATGIVIKSSYFIHDQLYSTNICNHFVFLPNRAPVSTPELE